MCIRDRSLREQIEQTNADIEKAQREYDLNKAAELKYGKLPQLQKQLEEEEKIAAAKKEDSLLRDRVTDEEIARIVARWTGIPVEKLVEGEREKLLHLDDVLPVSYTHLDVYKRQLVDLDITGCILILNEQQRGGQGHRQSSEDGEQCFENLHRFKPPW